MGSVSLSSQTAGELRDLIDAACLGEHADLPCANVVVVGAGNDSFPELFAHAAGATCATHDTSRQRGQDAESSHENHDDIYWLASCTKLVTSIACMQLVEQSVLRLDDADQLEELCPELKEVEVIQPDGSLAAKQSRITLRMLMTHTAGFGYSFLNPKLQQYCLSHASARGDFDEFSGDVVDFFQPLVNQPGEKFEYGISMDWVGMVVERVSGMRLNEYMQRNIFEPLGIQDLSMVPPESMRRRLVGIWHRGKDGHLSRRAFPLSSSISGAVPTEIFHSGGAGLYGSIREFGKILTMLLRDGRSSSSKVILQPETVVEMFRNQLSGHPDFGRRKLPAVKPELVYPAESLYPFCPAAPQGWGLSFMISPGPTGRSDTTVHWSGLSNLFWWCDREKGVGGVVASQVLPFADPKVAVLWATVEKNVYQGLKTI